MNKVSLIGRVTRDIPLQKTGNGTSVVNFTLAIRRDRDNADFIFCKAYGKRAEHLSMYVKKGSRIGVTGKIETWAKEKDGRREYGYSVNCDEIEFLENKAPLEEPKPTEPVAPVENYSPPIAIDESDLPF